MKPSTWSLLWPILKAVLRKEWGNLLIVCAMTYVVATTRFWFLAVFLGTYAVLMTVLMGGWRELANEAADLVKTSDPHA